MAEVEDKLLDHSYDGIQEFDNPLPPWWVGLFKLTVAWGVIYFFYFHIAGLGGGQLDELQAENKKIEEIRQKSAQSSSSIDLATILAPINDEETQALGKKVYEQYCGTCHGNQGEGGVCPAFADRYWLHGNSMQNIIGIIQNGVVEKGMVAWKGLLNNNDIAAVASYLKMFEGTTPPNLKAPQGELIEEVEQTDNGDTESVSDNTQNNQN